MRHFQETLSSSRAPPSFFSFLHPFSMLAWLFVASRQLCWFKCHILPQWHMEQFLTSRKYKHAVVSLRIAPLSVKKALLLSHSSGSLSKCSLLPQSSLLPRVNSSFTYLPSELCLELSLALVWFCLLYSCLARVFYGFHVPRTVIDTH